jgi:hypothetical protein
MFMFLHRMGPVREASWIFSNVYTVTPTVSIKGHTRIFHPYMNTDSYLLGPKERGDFDRCHGEEKKEGKSGEYII